MDQGAPRFLLAGAWMALLSLQGVYSFSLTEPPNLLPNGVSWTLPEDATQEQGYYLQQLFGQYGENGTLSFEGLTRLLLSLGLGKVQVVQIEHEALGHDHVSHLDLLEVQESKHLHSHSALEHFDKTEHGTRAQTESFTNRPAVSQLGLDLTTSRPVPNAQPGTRPKEWSMLGAVEHAGKGESLLKSPQSLHLWERVIALDHSVYNHLHEDCLNVSQLLVNFGLNSLSKISPEQFTLLCPALLYQIDSRVCIQHYDDEAASGMMGLALWPGLGWGFLAITLTSFPSAVAIVVVPLLSNKFFHFLLTFLIALAVGTLCGDALLHLWPHAQKRPHGGLLPPKQHPTTENAVLKGLCVLGGIYLLFLIENLMGTFKHMQAKRKRNFGKQSAPPPGKIDENSRPDLRTSSHEAAEFQSLTDPEAVNHCRTVPEQSIEICTLEECEASSEEQAEELNQQGHSHGTPGTANAGIAEIAWMVILGDGIHNFTDGLAIGAAFADGISGGLSTTLAVFCHELPHELGDCAILLQAGMPVRRVLLFNLLSAFLAYWGTVVGTVVSQSSSQVTPWIFALTSGIFLYVALVDMLPEILQRNSSKGRKVPSPAQFILQNMGFLMGGGIMLCIALLEGHLSFHVDG